MNAFNLNIKEYKRALDGSISEIILEDGTSYSKTVYLEDKKEVTITSNGKTTIVPTTGKDAMKKVVVTVNVE